LFFEISPGYFGAAGTALLLGRSFTWDDGPQAPPVAVVNQEFSRRLFGSPDAALGRFFKRRLGTRTQVVGIVEDGKYENLTESLKPVVFVPALQSPSAEMSVIVRGAPAAGGSGDPQALAVAMRTKLRELDPGLPCFIQPWTTAMGLVLFPSRMAAMALGILGVMAALLAITGIFGLAAYTVSRRLKELGIRLALGADGRDVLRAALARPLQLLAWGSALVVAGVAVVMLLLGLLATWVPAQRALSADPLVLLREE
jgi:hypothetical protein